MSRQNGSKQPDEDTITPEELAELAKEFLFGEDEDKVKAGTSELTPKKKPSGENRS